eukprot:CAMPEP_0115022636 /NCGR_PEP_ID=MMETSP0216-20121206/31700_1 /TAXON_ID=223996 /ORGANISM="Protocruzia adherens, Strain Boccale" /LENGTH=623 /DNA_ID=CAMNT_0002395421 /DNA_START=498 /DNA_END=2369 /DNA_ORIENTATION=+
MSWWDWARWEREIDWMAMRGVNMPLMFAGQEYVWIKTFEEFGVAENEMEGFFAGPAYLAWQWMGNIRGWGGPLTFDWINSHYDLGTKMFQRMREFGMKPVLPAFAGHVPRKFEELYPNSNITRASRWVDFSDDFCCISFVEPTDPLYQELTISFVNNLIKYFGPNDHLYNGDQFNEMVPPTNDPKYLYEVSSGMISAMRVADPHAIWVMQAWLFIDRAFWGTPQIEAYLSGVDDDSLILLDLWAEYSPIWEEVNSFMGKPYIWCQLLNFGGQQELHGKMETIMYEPHKAAAKSTMTGIGIAMEGIDNNAIMYDMLLDQAWMEEPIPVTDYVVNYLKARYGMRNEYAEQAWEILQGNVYNRRSVFFKPRMVFRPDGTWPVIEYDYKDVVEALELFLKAAPALQHVETYQYDLVDLTRQVLSDLFDYWLILLEQEYNLGDQTNFLKHRDFLIEVIKDMDLILATNKKFLLGVWIKDAESWAQSEDEIGLYRFNAKNQITEWGPVTSSLHDYSGKQWAGLVDDFHLPRWELYFKTLEEALWNKTDYDSELFLKESYALEEGWLYDSKDYPTEPQGDSVDIANQLIKKYRGLTEDHDTAHRKPTYGLFSFGGFYFILPLIVYMMFKP